jgi:predicted transcriptional regulator
MEVMMTIPELQAKVKEVNLNPHQLSMLAGISAPSIYRILAGKQGCLLTTMQKLEKAVEMAENREK